MKLNVTYAASIIMLILGLTSTSVAGPLEEGNAAYTRRDFATAMRILRPLAIQGDPMAADIVGLMYQNNFGVPLDYVSASLWFSLGATKGDKFSLLLLDGTLKKMTHREIDLMQSIARDWTPSEKPLNVTIEPETWLCDVKNQSGHVYSQEWQIANGRLKAPRGKGFPSLSLYNDQFIVGTLVLWPTKPKARPVTVYVIIEKQTGNYLHIDDINIMVMGQSPDKLEDASTETGTCKLKQ
ncbi:hypothetical protein [Rhodoblastus sp.]|uniref:hypothetical protein n=1 Tax=Rhodoblastus sp. TaxID=1962975 RepID=UPI003F951A13